jgi:CTP synthase
VIEKERSMYYKGKCVEVVPHIPMEVIGRIKTAAAKTKADVMVIEVGGTAGEYQNILFLEAARMMKLENPDNVAFVLVSYLPVPGHLGEMKTKPTQYASRTLNASGIQADFIIARGPDELDKPRREKLALLCGLRSEDDVIAAPDVQSIYEIPLILEKQKFAELLMKRLKMKARKPMKKEWDNFVGTISNIKKSIKIAVVGKYFATGGYTLADSYISVINAIKHAAWHNGVQAELTWIDAEEYEKHPEKIKELGKYSALIVPGGFGTRGIEGIIASIQYAREHNLPYLGLCYGMQLATIEFARHVMGLVDAHTVECNPKSKNLIININLTQAENVKKQRYGGTMRLGAYDCVLKPGSIARNAYGSEKISERHRHRYEFDNKYREAMEKQGMIVTGVNPQSDLVEIVELKKAPIFCRGAISSRI